MKFIVLSDIHGNLEALHEAIAFMERYPGARIYSLGDIVGYGANPSECISKIREIADLSLAGNHDHAVVGLTDIEYFNPYAKRAVLWTANSIEKDDRDYLSCLPLYKEFPDKLFLVHSTPLSPATWNYIFTLEDARVNFCSFRGPLCFVGHSHIPKVFEYAPQDLYPKDREEAVQFKEDYRYNLKEGHRYIVNVGSIEQPRDGDWRACLVLYDDEENSLEFKRLEYDLVAAQNKILDAGLPETLAERLSYGR